VRREVEPLVRGGPTVMALPPNVVAIAGRTIAPPGSAPDHLEIRAQAIPVLPGAEGPIKFEVPLTGTLQAQPLRMTPARQGIELREGANQLDQRRFEELSKRLEEIHTVIRQLAANQRQVEADHRRIEELNQRVDEIRGAIRELRQRSERSQRDQR